MKLFWIIFVISLSYGLVKASSKPCRNPDNPSVFYYQITKLSDQEKAKEYTRKSEEIDSPDVNQFIESFEEFMENHSDMFGGEWDSHEEQGMDSMNDFRESFDDFMQEFSDNNPSEDGMAYYEEFREQFEEFMQSFRGVVFYGNNECVTLKQWTSFRTPPANTFII